MNSMTQLQNNINFTALLSFEEIQAYETDEVGIMRRMTLATLTRSFDELLESTLQSEQEAEVFLNLLDCSANCVEYLKEMLQLAEQAKERLGVVGHAYLEQQQGASK
ncbi:MULTISPECIES: hypothetical protein [Acinetobacter]|uniref:Uncharacterized protein n=1 Tax=Acinetobacter baylyi (strain ATCC 33305 / BD413 / ADP1) TaxID=62977 RepID=Q6FAH2_ACIAD|nr:MULTISPECIES: hypothetical protein [Acinetobacter]ENV53875.1 hypothetical protein F952_01928 [Acinetobacter baylyi DSM 14961 = CIP 107474]KAF2373156.1 hypothetical protein BSL88_00525 [Acinetobacter baylyi]KAF2374429.1 hypothetical protein BSL67_07395 [Acinetobacter baylyi]KAF2377200.1 hypothetical protein BSN81_10070 [Acinetobacter baylyi]KAF2380988.1 hypothetical protein BSN83_07610 [Acinetobacter baylyi]